MTIEQIKSIQIHFVVSTARTGSTLLSSMFNMHPNLLSPVEEPFAFNLYYKYNSIKKWDTTVINEFCYDFYLFSEGVLDAQFGSKNELALLLEEHKEELNYLIAVKIAYLCFCPDRIKNNITMVIDKQLKFHDFIEKVAVFFPESKFVILTRDPRDNALVKMKRIVREGDHENVFDRKNNYYHLALDWNREYNLLYSKMKEIGEQRFLQLRYEDLVERPEEELKRVANFLKFEYKSIMLDYHQVIKAKALKIINTENVAKQHFYELHKSLTEKVNTNKVGLWKSNLRDKDANIVWSICHERAMQMGYMPEGCEIDCPKSIAYFVALLKFWLFKIVVPTTYYAVPFFVRYFGQIYNGF